MSAVEEFNPLEPDGCAACDRGEKFTEARAYVHTGAGVYCKRRQITKLEAPEPEPTPRAVTKTADHPRGQYICGNCTGVGHNARTCKLPRKL